MSNPRFSPEFKDEAVRQVTERGSFQYPLEGYAVSVTIYQSRPTIQEHLHPEMLAPY